MSCYPIVDSLETNVCRSIKFYKICTGLAYTCTNRSTVQYSSRKSLYRTQNTILTKKLLAEAIYFIITHIILKIKNRSTSAAVLPN